MGDLGSSRHIRRTFLNRMRHGYKLSDDQKRLILTVKTAPWSVNRNNKNVIFTTADRITNFTFTVLKDSERNEILKAMINDPKTISMNAHTFLDKVHREGYLGITRRYIHYFLKNHPFSINVRMNQAIHNKPITKSFRPEYPFQHWQMDLIIMGTYNKNKELKELKGNKGYKYILVIIDIFTKFIYLYPLKKKEGIDVASILSRVFLSGDIPDTLQSDNGSEFRNATVHGLCQEFKIKQLFSESYSPQTQGFVENKNKQIKQVLNTFFIKYDTMQWFDILDRVAYSINNSKHFVTGYTPLQLHRGRDPGVRFHITFDENTSLENMNTVANLEYNEVHDSELEKHFSQTNSLYNKRVLHVSNVLKSEAIKREMIQDKEPDIKIGSIVKVKTYVKTNTDDIQGIILKIGQMEIQNPITYREEGKKQFLDTTAIKKSQVSKVLLNKEKFYKNKIFIVMSELKNTENSKRYTLQEYQTENKVYRKLANQTDMVDRLGLPLVWSEYFMKSHLIVLNPQEFNSFINQKQQRPEFLHFEGHLFKEPKKTKTTIQTEKTNNNQVKRIIIPGDGNCMFSAVIEGLNRVDRLPVTSHRKKINTAFDLRQEVVRLIYEECSRNSNVNNFLARLNASNYRNGNRTYQTCEEYKNYMQQDKAWGGNIELSEIRTILRNNNINLLVYILDNDTIKIQDGISNGEPNMNKPFVRLLYVGNNHYDTLLFSESDNKTNNVNDNKTNNVNNNKTNNVNNKTVPFNCTIQSLLNTGEYTQYIQFNKKNHKKKSLAQLGIKEATMIMLKNWKDHVNGGTGKHIYQFKVNKLDESTYRTGALLGQTKPKLYELQLTGKILDKQSGQLKQISHQEAGFPTRTEFDNYKIKYVLEPRMYLPEQKRRNQKIPVESWYFYDEDEIVQACIKKKSTNT